VGAADASRRKLVLLESNADTKSRAMMDYYAKMESSFDATTESEAAARSKRFKLPSHLISSATSLHSCNICVIRLKHNSIVCNICNI
jgi:phage gp36-like protein